MAGAMIGEGTSYPDLTYTVKLNSEEYGVGFRKGSDLAEAFNTFWEAAYADGTVMTAAETYGVQESPDRTRLSSARHLPQLHKVRSIPCFSTTLRCASSYRR